MAMKSPIFITFIQVVLGLIVTIGAFAGEPTEDFEVIRDKLEGWLFFQGDPPISSPHALYELMVDGNPDNDPVILSTRKPEHFRRGHLVGAVNIPWDQVAKPESLAKLSPDVPIVSYSSTSHNAAVAMAALSLMDYSTTTMKFGMMTWTKNDHVLATDRFDPKKAPAYAVEIKPNEATQTYDYPALEIKADEEADTIRVALDNYLSSGKKKEISAVELYEKLNDGDKTNDPFIVSVRDPKHYATGHIPGAINIFWKELADPDNLTKLPPDRPIVTYCYVGYLGAMATTALNVLGYNVVNLKYGIMGWNPDPRLVAVGIYDPSTQEDDYPLEMGTVR